MKELTVEDIQKRGLEMLSFFDKYASEHNIKYFLSGGTLLGAVRHQGFIPWDDDIDLMLPRDDYERLIEDFEETEEYKILSCDKMADYEYDYARIIDKSTKLEWKDYKTSQMGVFVDLFPIDGFPRSRALSNLHSIHVFFIKNLWASAMVPGEWNKSRVAGVRNLIRIFTAKPNNYCNHINRIAKMYDYNKCDYAGVAITTHYLFKERNRRAIYDEVVRLNFEKLLLPAPKQYNEYLEQLYGDYMKLPPEEKRISEHEFIAWELDQG